MMMSDKNLEDTFSERSIEPEIKLNAKSVVQGIQWERSKYHNLRFSFLDDEKQLAPASIYDLLIRTDSTEL